MTRAKKKFDQPSSLVLKTAELVKKRNLTDVSLDTGIPYHWLTKFAGGIHKNPSANRIQFLYEYLTGSKLI